MPISHYLWAGLDFMFDEQYQPVLLDVNRSSHMLWEYMKFHQDERPFQLAAAALERRDGPVCLLWRRSDPPFQGTMAHGETAPFIGHYLARHLRRPPHVCFVEDNQTERDVLTAASGESIVPGSVFRWWYQIPWSYERAGAVVVNPNSVWMTVRDKHRCYDTLGDATTFRVPETFRVETLEDVDALVAQRPALFARGYVLKPRVGWGGQGVQVVPSGARADIPLLPPGYLLSERIVPPERASRRYWDVRVFVMNGEYCGGIMYANDGFVTNYHRGGVAEPLPADLSERLREPAVEAVTRIDAAAAAVADLPAPPVSDLVNVVY